MTKPIYFPELNSIRAFASLLVLVCHIDQFSYLFNIENLGFSEIGRAGFGVNIFCEIEFGIKFGEIEKDYSYENLVKGILEAVNSFMEVGPILNQRDPFT